MQKANKNKDWGGRCYFEPLTAGKNSINFTNISSENSLCLYYSWLLFFSSFLVSKSYCVDEYIVCFQQFSHSTKTLVDCCLEAAWIGGWGHYFTLENILYLTVLSCPWQGRATKNKTILQVIFIPVNFQMWWFNKILESGVNLASWRRMKVALE